MSMDTKRTSRRRGAAAAKMGEGEAEGPVTQKMKLAEGAKLSKGSTAKTSKKTKAMDLVEEEPRSGRMRDDGDDESHPKDLSGSWDDLRMFLVRDRARTLLDRDSRNPTCLRISDSLREAFSLMAEHDLLACPILDWEDKFVGFLTMLDLASYAVDLARNCGKEETQSPEFWNSSREFRNALVGNISRMSKRRETHRNCSIMHLMENLHHTEGDPHHIALLTEDSKVAGVITQSALLRYLLKSCGLLGLGARISIAQFRPFTRVVSCKLSDRACDAFLVMREQGIGGLAVTDDRGALKDVLSARDLRCIRPGNRTFAAIFDTIEEFKGTVLKERMISPKSPVTVGRQGTLSDVMNLMVENRVHRVFVEERGQCVDIITITDVTRFIMKELQK